MKTYGTTAWFRGRVVYKAAPDGRKCIMESWRVTQHRGSLALLLRVAPASARPERKHVALTTSVVESPFSASRSAAIQKALVQAQALIERIEGYRAEDCANETELYREYTNEITDLRYAMTAMRKEA